MKEFKVGDIIKNIDNQKVSNIDDARVTRIDNNSNIVAFSEKVSEAEQENIMKELHEQKVQSYKDRIATLTEKFKNDPAKLAVLSKCAQDLQDAE